jgi:hypothetical protein
MLRAYHAQQSQHASIDTSAQDQDQEQTWPQKRYYRAYSQADDDCIAAIQAKYGIHAKEEAVRLALHLAAGDAIKVTTAAPVARKVVIKLKARVANRPTV